MLITHPAFILKNLYPSLEWGIKTRQKKLYLTFDDGPTSGVTDKLLELLRQYDAKATFFCLGKNIAGEKALFQEILNDGHEVGNHTYSHLNGWKSKNIDYLRDVERFQEEYKSNLFRPPYGRLKPSQIFALRKNYRIIMWSALSRDYHPAVSAEECYRNATKKLNRGDIILFHDSQKAAKNMLYAVERILKEKSSEGYAFQSLSS